MSREPVDFDRGSGGVCEGVVGCMFGGVVSVDGCVGVLFGEVFGVWGCCFGGLFGVWYVGSCGCMLLTMFMAVSSRFATLSV